MRIRYPAILATLFVLSGHTLAKDIPECSIPVNRPAYDMSIADHRFELHQCLKLNAADAISKGDTEKAKKLNAEAEAVAASCG